VIYIWRDQNFNISDDYFLGRAVVRLHLDETICIPSSDFEWALTSHDLTFEIQEFRKPEYKPIVKKKNEMELLYGQKAKMEAFAEFYSGGDFFFNSWLLIRNLLSNRTGFKCSH
jgi:hypothetical protein